MAANFSMVLMLAIIVISLVLLKKQKLTKIARIVILVINVALGGIILGASQNPVNPFQMIPVLLSSDTPVKELMPQILPLIFVVVVQLVLAFIFGRLYCGYACPLGGLQELASKIRIKLKVKKEVKVPSNIAKLLEENSKIIRGIFLFIFVGGIYALQLVFAKFVNPFLGFPAIKGENPPMMIIPLVILIGLFVLSIFVYRPYCRFACPFGAIVSEVANFSRLEIVRNDNCISCGLCEKICPTGEAFADSKKGECYYCGRCIDVCPKDALEYSTK